MFRTLLLASVAVSLVTGAAAAPKTVARPRPRPAPAPAPILTPPEQAIVMAKRNLERVTADQYAAQEPLDSFVGKTFTIEIKPTTTYSEGVLDIYLLTTTIYPNESADFKDAHRFENHPSVEIRDVSATKRGSYVGQNAFGTRVAVSRIDLDYALLMFVNRPEDSQYLVRVRLPGPDAKVLSTSARVVVTGKISSSDSGKIAGCETRYSGATIDHPTSGTARRCWVAVELQSMVVLDKAGGRILGQWTPESPKASILSKPEPISFDP
ncbi:hypothetical protein [Caulobacter sp. RL271]|uniref:Uncharacterized protein n=1 Tax=Caulobacter segnis TaxID=88688 RepID=A0ABY4ZVK7_9CAUL|nr:hypothetical protein [Caulobacter segnis]USQ96520.1 hypothetical protein MZV50_02695 [Caulobacter segnis]